VTDFKVFLAHLAKHLGAYAVVQCPSSIFFFFKELLKNHYPT